MVTGEQITAERRASLKRDEKFVMRVFVIVAVIVGILSTAGTAAVVLLSRQFRTEVFDVTDNPTRRAPWQPGMVYATPKPLLLMRGGSEALKDRPGKFTLLDPDTATSPLPRSVAEFEENTASFPDVVRTVPRGAAFELRRVLLLNIGGEQTTVLIGSLRDVEPPLDDVALEARSPRALLPGDRPQPRDTP
ncbi:MAG: hypothetical protein IBJ11_05200 [Phycisphaerales bacterium]|nr:hypothetical protein [Phycisphaerales bacterium]